MTRLIDADALMDKISSETIFIKDGLWVSKIIADAPTIEPSGEKHQLSEETSTTKVDTSTNTSTNTSEVSVEMPTIKKGSTGKAVKVWQIIVGTSVDGDFGTKTRTATIEFQRKHKLAQDGVVGKNTWGIGLETL